MAKEAIKYKLGLDLGSTSLGWAVVELNDKDNPTRLVDMGVRIFPDGRDAQSHEPANVTRRTARGMRRRSDRILLRKKRTLELIKKYGLDFDIRADKSLENPYALRVQALDKRLSPSELGRVLFHFSVRRGFKSNRKETRGQVGGKISNATERLASAMGKCDTSDGGYTYEQTLGQWQYENKQYRFKNLFNGTMMRDDALYPTRDMYLDEFHKICDAQQLPEQMRTEFEHAIFNQGDMKSPQPGYCQFEDQEFRAYRYEPEFQKWRALQRINQLKILGQGIEEELTNEQRQKLYDTVLNTFEGVRRTQSGAVKISFSEIKRQLGLSVRNTKFNLESNKNEDGVQINVDTTGFGFFEIGEFDFWNSLSADQRSEILKKINDSNLEDDDVINYLIQNYNLSLERAEKIIKIPLEDDTANVSLKAIRKMLPFLEQGDLYHKAVEKAGYDFGKHVERLTALPYYGELKAIQSSLTKDRNGVYRIMNATVHIALNQLRVVVNDLLKQYGLPQEIAIEMGRDVQANSEERKEIDAQQKKNKKENDRIVAELRMMNKAVNKENIQRFKLWEKLDSTNAINRRCVYSGEMISQDRIFSPEFEVDHILPYSLTFDDSMANKILCLRQANRFKKNRCPYDAFNASDSPWEYNSIWERAKNLPESTKWRFERGALERYLKDMGCIERDKNDTRYITRVAVVYLQHLYGDKEKYKVYGTRGNTTKDFRIKWGLNWWKNKADKEKYRANHIHHAIDAFVIACTHDASLEKLQKNSRNAEITGNKDKAKEGIELPFPGFDYVDFKEKCENTIISYKRSKKDPRPIGTTIGCLHEDTAYNLEEFESDKNIKARMSRRQELPTINQEKKGNKDTDADATKKEEKAEKKLKKFFKEINPKTKEMFSKATGCAKDDEHSMAKFLDWAKNYTVNGKLCPIKKVRVIKSGVDISTYVPIFRTKQDRDEYWNAYTQWYVQNGISAGIKDDKKKKKEQQAKEKELLENLKRCARRAYKWYVGGNNFCAEIFEIRSDDKRYPKDAGTWQMEIISNYIAELNGGEPFWRKKYSTARRVMSLRINDLVIAEFSKDDPDLPAGLKSAVAHQCAFEKKNTVEIVLRVKSLDAVGKKVWLRAHYVAKEDKNTQTWQAPASGLQLHKVRKIFVSPTGKILK